jgi:hypothetical protein
MPIVAPAALFLLALGAGSFIRNAKIKGVSPLGFRWTVRRHSYAIGSKRRPGWTVAIGANAAGDYPTRRAAVAYARTIS